MKKKGLVFLITVFGLAFIWRFGVTNAGPASQASVGQSAEANILAQRQFVEAVTLLKQDNFSDAIAAYEKVIQLLPESPIAQDARYWIGQTYFRMGKYDEALSVFKKLLKEYPKSPIVPATQLMVARVEQEKEAKKDESKRDPALDQKIIIDPNTGAEFRKIHVLAGKSDVVDYVPSGVFLSPNGKFLLYHKTVIPMDGQEPFDLVDEPALRSIWSPDGKKVAFFLNDAICMIPVSPETCRATGPVRKLLDGKYRFQNPINWSPDSEKIVFMRRDDETVGDIWTLSVNNGDLKRITNDPEPEFAASWSPDGNTITYSKDSEIWAVAPDGGEPRKLIDNRGLVFWAPDGRYLAFLTSGYKFHLFRLADKRMIDLKLPEGVGEFLSWSPDSKRLLFYYSSYDYSIKLKVVSSKGGPTFELGRNLKLWPYLHQWSPDSQWVITTGQDVPLWMIPLSGGQASPVEEETLHEGTQGVIALSPDSKKILFTVNRDDGKDDLYVAPFSLEKGRTTGPAVEVLKGWERNQARWEYSWSSDGDKIAVIHQGDVWILPAQKGNPIQLTKTKESETLPKWAPHREMIAYLAEIEQGKHILRVISSSTGEIKKTMMDNSGLYGYAWSPNGKRLVAASEDMITVTSFPENETRSVVDRNLEGLFSASGFCWLPDGKSFAFIGQKGREAPTRIYVVPAEGGKMTELAADDDDWKDWVYVSPDGKWISYDAEGWIKNRPESSIWEVKVEDLAKEKK